MYCVDALDSGRGTSSSTDAGVTGASSAGGSTSGAGSGWRPVACSNVGGGEFGTSIGGLSVDGGGWAGGSVDWNVGGRRDVDVVGKGKGGGASLFSGRSTTSVPNFWSLQLLRERE
jgi:hypothetical protein